MAFRSAQHKRSAFFKSAHLHLMRHTYLVCYDVSEDKRRDQIFRVCKNYGTRLQFSVFECDLNGMELAGMKRELLDIVAAKEDQVLFVSLGPTEGRGDRVISALGRPYTKIDAPCYVA